jgi:hypothetical protein
MSSDILFFTLVTYSILGSIYHFFESVGSGIDYGFTTLYNDTIGKLTAAFDGASLSAAESLFIDAESAVLSFAAVASGYVGSIMGGIFGDIADIALAPSLGIIGPIIAVIIIVGLFMAIVIGVRLLIDVA